MPRDFSTCGAVMSPRIRTTTSLMMAAAKPIMMLSVMIATMAPVKAKCQ